MVLHIYGLLIGLGIWLGVELAGKIQKQLTTFHKTYQQISLDQLLLWLAIPAVVGARVYHVIDYWSYYQQNLIKVLYLWQGGLGIFGAILGGLLGLVLYLWYSKKISLFLYSSDILVFALPLAQAIGRLGNFYNQELFGSPSTLPWAIFIPLTKRPVELVSFTHFHPLFAYEALLNLALLWGLWWQSKRKHKIGFFTAIYFLGYGLIRFSLEFLRLDPWTLGILTTGQWMSLVFIASGIVLLWRRR